MKLLSFRHGGIDGYGIAVDDGVVDASRRLGTKFPDLKSALADGMAELAALDSGTDADFSLDEIEFRPTIPNPDKIICVGLNYKKHVEETGRGDADYPALFTRFANTQVGHEQPLVLPTHSDRFDYEGELAMVIGKAGRHIPAERAFDHIAGYACYNDGSIRDWQRHTHQFTPGKNFPHTGGFGPWIVTTDEIPDPTALTLVTRLNGTEMQRATTDQLIFDIPYLINYLSTFTELVPGDVIPTGTPGGVGFKRTPPVFMRAGDTVEVEITGIGTLVNPIVAE
ncbi:MAG: fumarylacetoacetate hydrolase family protein [Alphaproteobacteria bacterium]|nr:fumarylacetoacetate hydrolase family protein [Alphaproteobacteria bacterium]